MIHLLIITLFILSNCESQNANGNEKKEYKLAKINQEATHQLLLENGKQYVADIYAKKESGQFVETTEFDAYKKKTFIGLDLSKAYSTLSEEMLEKLANFQEVLEKGLDNSQKLFTTTSDSHFEMVSIGVTNNDIKIHIYSLAKRGKVTLISGLCFFGCVIVAVCFHLLRKMHWQDRNKNAKNGETLSLCYTLLNID